MKFSDEGGINRAGISLEHYLGKTLGKNSSIPCMPLGLEPVQVRNNAAAGTAKQFTVSWSSPTSPVVPEIFPRQAFDRLFNTGEVRNRKFWSLNAKDDTRMRILFFSKCAIYFYN